MTQRDDLDRLLSTWLDDPYTPPAPQYLGRVLERTRQTRQRPAWASLERWLPMADKVLQPTVGAAASRGLAPDRCPARRGPRRRVVARRLTTPSPPPAIPQGGSAVFAFSSSRAVTSHGRHLPRRGPTARISANSPRGPGIESSPTWSPDGTRIAYRVMEDGNDSIVVIDAGGGNATTLGHERSDRDVLCRARRPDMVARTAGPSSSRPARGATVASTSSSCRPTGRHPRQAADPGSAKASTRDWSPDGSRIAFQGRDATGNIGYYVVDWVRVTRSRAGFRRVRSLPVLMSTRRPLGEWWSPDGTELAVVSDTE